MTSSAYQLASLAILLKSASILNASDPRWGREYRAHPQSGISSSVSQFVAAPDGNGYMLSYGTYSSPFRSNVAMRIDDHGNLLWAAYLNLPESPMVAHMSASQGEQAIFTGYATQSGTAFLGINEGATMARKFGVSLPVMNPAKLTFHHLSDGSSVLLEDLGTSISVMLLAPSGEKLFDRTLHPAGLSQSPKRIDIRKLSTSPGYLVTFTDHVVKRVGTSPMNPDLYTRRLYLSRLDIAGNHLGTTQVSFDTEGVNEPTYATGSTGETLFQFTEARFAQFNYIYSTRLVCIRSDYSLGWSGIINGALLDSVAFEGEDFWLGGSKQVELASRATLLRVSASNGNLLAQSSLTLPTDESSGWAKPVGLHNERLSCVWQVGFTPIVSSLDKNLANPLAMRVNDVGSSPATVILEPAEGTLLVYNNGSVTAIDPNLATPDECGRLSAQDVTLWPGGLSIDSFQPVIAAVSTSASDRVRSLTAATLPVQAPDTWVRKLCGPEELKPVVLHLERPLHSSSYRLRFETDSQTTYFLDFSNDLTEGYFETESWNGSGWSIIYPLTNMQGEQRFFRLRAVRP